MAKLIYSAITSLDGYVADEEGNFDWAEPDEEVHSFLNDLERPVGTYLYGRRLYEVMRAWETMGLADQPPYIQDFAEIWQGADKIVFSRTLQTVPTANTRLERDFDGEAIRQLKAAAGRDILVGGPDLASEAFTAGLVDELPLRRTDDRGRWEAVASRQRHSQTRTAGRTPFPQRHGSPSLPRRHMRKDAYAVLSAVTSASPGSR